MKDFYFLLTLVLVLALGLVVGPFAAPLNPSPTFDLAFLVHHLTLILFLSLVVERATEVFLTMHFDPSQAARTEYASALERRLASLKYTLNHTYGPSHSPEADLGSEITGLEGQRQALTQEILHATQTIKPKKIRTAGCFSTMVSGLLALVGVSTISPLLGQPQVAESWQSMGLNVVDMILTTLLLAGGAKGVHRILKAMALKPARPV